jgi:fused signal recognition particle receptor
MFGSSKWTDWTQKLKVVLGATTADSFPKEELEKLLFESDLTASMIQRLMKKTDFARREGKDSMMQALVDETISMLRDVPSPPMNLPTPGSLMLVGVNGSGKTTTAARLANHYRKNGRNVILGAADTFRAGAVDQLKAWGARLGIEVVAKQTNADPASVVFDTWQVAKERSALMIADTAGRIHTHTPLMDELQKVVRILSKDGSGAPHETLLVLDGTSGQNAILQSREFSKIIPVTGLIITKLDGTSKGGGALSASLELKLPIRFIGIGEKEDDLIEFNLDSFVRKFYGF